ncbi:MAG: TonB family protein [SAR324 cluster bacterium]|nr:TonB family protein [SAR324 cluster bacterium]
MSADSLQFNGVLGGTLVLHLLLFLFVFALPGGAPNPEMVRIYRVKVVEAPARPTVKRLELSTQPISELKLETPALSLEAPPESETPALERPPQVPPPEPPAVSPAAPAAQPVAPPPKAAEADPVPNIRALRELPSAPAPAARERVQAPPPPARSTQQASAPPLAPPVAEQEPQRPTLLERVRSRVEKFEFEKTTIQKAGEPGATAAVVRSPISLRMYLNRVQEAIMENYSFPGGFKEGLWVRMRLTILRDGTISKMEILESSGDARFDYAAKIALRRTKLPDIPQGIEGESITQVIKFTP